MTEQEKQEFEAFMKKVRSRCKDNEIRRKTMDISCAITWGNLANQYFGKSASWFYNKMNGIDGNGKPTEFSAEELQILKDALNDLARRIRVVSDNL